MIKRIISLLFIFIVFFSLNLSSSHAEQFITTLNGRNVNLDWSAMPESQSCTLYYALADYKGDIDISTLGAIEMGTIRNVYLPNLPSGLIVYMVVVAHAAQGDVVSNLVQFMPFGGTITFPETGDVLMRMDDPEGIGNISIIGAKNADNSEISISQISGNTGSGPFSILVDKNGNIFKYTGGNVEIRYVHEGVGSFSYEFYENGAILYSGSGLLAPAGQLLALNSLTLRPETMAVSDRSVDCGLSKDEYMQQVRQSKKIADLEMKLNALSSMLYVISPTFVPANSEGDTIRSVLFWLNLEAEILMSTIDDVRAQEAARYDSMCSGEDPPEISPGCGECSIPSGAQLKSHVENEELAEYYMLNGHYAGPYMGWYDETRTRPKRSACYDDNGELHGALCIWFDNGNIRQNQYNHGVIVQDILWYASGNLSQERFYLNGETVEVITYYDIPNRYKQHNRYNSNGILNGLQETWYENGNRKETFYYVGGKMDGERSYYREDGTLEKICTYANGLQQGCTDY